MKTKAMLTIVLLCTIVQMTWAWDGDGTSANPYRIQSSADWKQLADDVNGGNSYSDTYFAMTADIDAEGISVGSESKPFSGSFSGGMYTLTYNAGTMSVSSEGNNAPFVLLNGATIKDLKVAGYIYSKSKYAAGLACYVDGAKTTTITGCHVSVVMYGDPMLAEEANFGGFVALVKSTVNDPLVFKNCSFQGSYLGGFAAGSACFVGFTRVPLSFEKCVVDPGAIYIDTPNTATFVRTADGVTCKLTECYYTQAYGTAQGQGVFTSVKVPQGCTAEILGEPTWRFNGVSYYGSGTRVKLTVPEGTAFDHWETTGKNMSCYVSDPWTRDGIHTIADIYTQPQLSIATSMPKARKEREMDGTKYRYLGAEDYRLYMSHEYCAQKGFEFDKDGWLVKMVDGKTVYVTAVTGWIPGKIPDNGAQIHNDLSGDSRDYTLTALIAPHAFQGCTELKTLYFKDTDATHFNAQTKFDFQIGDYAFANCSNLTEIKMMQYTTEGDNHWEALTPDQVSEIGDSVFNHSPQAMFSTDASQYQNYLSSTVWKNYQQRIIIYNHTFRNMEVNGAVYTEMYTTAGDPIKNDAAGHDAIMQQLQFWNADYQQFKASSLLSNSSKNIWYTQVIGADDGYLKDNGGVMRVYNDPGSQYNYKTIAIKSLGGSKEVKHIEFYQTNGLSDNSYTDLKLVIQNNAFAGCDSLKELRMFYHVEDGEDHWMALGPKDVIPGDNIFGLKQYTDEEIASGNVNFDDGPKVSKDFKILVATELCSQFMNDPNWKPYLGYIEPVDFFNSQKKDFTRDGLTYGFMTSAAGMLQTSQVVSQDLSLWTIPRIAIEVVLVAYSIYSALATPTEGAATQMAGRVHNATALHEEAEQALLKAQAQREFIDQTSAQVTAATEQYFAEKTADTKANLIKALCKLNTRTKNELFLQHSAEECLTQYGFLNDGFLNLTEAKLAAHDKFGLIANVLNSAMKNAVKKQAAMVATKEAAVQTYQNSLLEVVAQSLDLTQARTMNPWLSKVTGVAAAATAVGTLIASECWGSSGTYDAESLKKGMRNNILSNIHQVGFVGGGYVITTPTKNIVYHTYIKNVEDQENVTIYAGFDDDNNSSTSNRTMTCAKDAFRNKKKVKTIRFHAMKDQTSNAAMPMLFTIPDSAFVGCDNLTELNLLLQDNEGGTRPLGPENFVLAGDSIFVGKDPAKFHIVIDPSRKQDFLDNESWAPLERFFTYQEARPVAKFNEYGGRYAYSYENNSIKREHKVSGHLIEHTIVTGADYEFLREHGGALKLCNDIGVYDNYQLDAVASKAFYGNDRLRCVYFTDLKGTGAFGDCYTDLDVTLQDSCFANCKNLADLDLLYMVTDGTNHIDLIKPEQVKIGNGVFDGTDARIKMMPQQVEWFAADSSWVKYKDRFMPCVIQPGDDGIKEALKGMEYYDMAHTGYDTETWDDYYDLARIGGTGFSWLDTKFREQKDDIYSFTEFKYFESVGLDYVGKEWFRGCSNLSNIVLPNSIKTIQPFAFASCYKLTEIALPAAVTEIGDEAFNDCPVLTTIRVLGTTPAKLTGKTQFSRNDGLKIYVPAASVEAYKTAWVEYKDYIVSDADYKINKVVKLDKAGTLADKLGLYVEWSYTGITHGDEPYLLHGPYAKYDSLTVSGPLNDLDLWVICYLAGVNGYYALHRATDGQLRYLNLYDASIKKDPDCKAHILNGGSWVNIGKDNELPSYVFGYCIALETIIMPKSLTSFATSTFIGCKALKRVALTGALKEYDGWYLTGHQLDYPLEELVMLTDQHATTSAKDAWGATLQQVYTYQSQIGDYMNDLSLITQAQAVNAPFKDDAVMKQLAAKGEFFPSEYLTRESVEDIFNNGDVKDFDDFNNFVKVKQLMSTFNGAANMKRITLPASIDSIAAEAFAGCAKLDTIRVVGVEPAGLAENAFRDLPKDFRILVPRRFAKLYRTRWAQYADHINADDTYMADGNILTVTVTAPNTLAQALGLKIDTSTKILEIGVILSKVQGDYSNIRKLKVIGPIGALDLDLMRYLAGYCPWTRSRNYTGHLEYLDLYDTSLRSDGYKGVLGEFREKNGTVVTTVNLVPDDILPKHAFLRAYNLKTLILPNSCKNVRDRALQECEGLETLVIGTFTENFNWNALDDDASLTRMYILAKKKVYINEEFPVWRWLCNNYNPTFDAFYVLPSLYKDYLQDDDYTGSSWQRTNNISTGDFTDDASFRAFAAHGAATHDELINITSVKGWFESHPEVRDLSALGYTCVDRLDKATIAPLKELEQIALPLTLGEMEEGLFENAKHLRYADFLLSDSTDIVANLRNGGFAKYGINTQQTLAFVPSTYGQTDETNVIVSNSGTLRTKTYRMVDSLSYIVPYAFETEKIENSRPMQASAVPYTVCVPYKMKVPAYSRAYKLSERDGNSLVFTEVTGELEAMKPYLVKVVGNKRYRKMSTTLDTEIAQTIPASDVNTYGRQDDALGYSLRGTFDAIGNKDAADLGAYILQDDGNWHPVVSDFPADKPASILPFRAYLLPSARNAGARISMTLEDEDATDIDCLETIDEDGTRRYYDLNGRELQGKPAKGVYIYKGKTYINK